MTENFLKGLIFLINKWTKKEAAVERLPLIYLFSILRFIRKAFDTSS